MIPNMYIFVLMAIGYKYLYKTVRDMWVRAANEMEPWRVLTNEWRTRNREIYDNLAAGPLVSVTKVVNVNNDLLAPFLTSRPPSMERVLFYFKSHTILDDFVFKAADTVQ